MRFAPAQPGGTATIHRDLHIVVASLHVFFTDIATVLFICRYVPALCSGNWAAGEVLRSQATPCACCMTGRRCRRALALYVNIDVDIAPGYSPRGIATIWRFLDMCQSLFICRHVPALCSGNWAAGRSAPKPSHAVRLLHDGSP